MSVVRITNLLPATQSELNAPSARLEPASEAAGIDARIVLERWKVVPSSSIMRSMVKPPPIRRRVLGTIRRVEASSAAGAETP